MPSPSFSAECAAPKEDNTTDCEYVYGSYGTIIDARDVLKDGTTKVLGNWITGMTSCP